MVALIVALATITFWLAASAQGDITPPVVVSIAIEPAQFSTALTPVTVTVTVHITDDLSGLQSALLIFRPTVGTTQWAEVQFAPSQLVTGTLTDGLFRNSFVLPRYAAEGWWETFQISFSDAVGNRKDLYDSSVDGPVPPELLAQSRFHNGPAPQTTPAAYLPLAFAAQ